MTTKSEWQAINRELAAEQRRTLGEPPTAEEMQNYFQGDLPEGEMERIRDLLVAYPDLARMYAEPFPADEPASDDADYVSDAELDRRWGALQSRLGNDAGDADAGRTVAPPPEQGRVLPFRHFPSLAAAALALIFAGLYWQAESRLRQVRAERAEPWVLAEPQQVFPDTRRGPSDSATTIRLSSDVVTLTPLLFNEMRYGNYRVELRDFKTQELLWSTTDVRVMRDDADSASETFWLQVPNTFLVPDQKYQIVVFGLDGTGAKQLESYTIRVLKG